MSREKALLRRAKYLLDHAMRLHTLSVTIGYLTPVSSAAVAEMEQARRIIEDSDRCAGDIAAHLERMNNNKEIGR